VVWFGFVSGRCSAASTGAKVKGADAPDRMSLEQLRLLVQDAERQPPLRALLRGCHRWSDLIERASSLGYGIEWADLVQASQEDAASRFLERARIEPVADLLGGLPGRGPQLSWRRLASTSR
jgi:hypothetical protein